MKNKKNIGIEDRIVFISNTLGSFILGFYFGGLKTVAGYIIGAYCLLNIFCYLITIRELYGGEK